MMHEREYCCDEAAHSCSILSHPNSFHGGMFKLNAKFDVDQLLYLLSHFECDSHIVDMLPQQCPPPPLTSTVMSSLFTLHSTVHSPWLPGYIDVAQTILVTLTMVELFPGYMCIYIYIYTHIHIYTFYIHLRNYFKSVIMIIDFSKHPPYINEL